MKLTLVVTFLFFTTPLLAEATAPTCKLKLEPGKSIGPFQFSSSLKSIQGLYPKAKVTQYNETPENGLIAYVQHEGLNASFCNGEISDIWVDLQKPPRGCIA